MMKNIIVNFIFLMVFSFSCQVVSAMIALDDEELSRVHGQALLVADFIAPSGASGSATDFSFFRMGLDVMVEMNMNIDKLQLGCGGFNESIRSGCDIDLDFVRFMGADPSGNNPLQPSGARQAGDPVVSDFILMRPYIELAVRGEGGNREIAGFKVGAQSADGFMGVGRRYENGQMNQETGVLCNTNNPITCHSGINSLSGNLNVEVSGNFPLTATAWPLSFSGEGCFGRTSLNSDCANNPPLIYDVSGTRINALALDGIALNIDLGTLANLFGITSAYANVDQDLRFIHGFVIEEASDFFISFQREAVAYPTYEKDGYAVPANAGWWMNVPNVKATDISGERVTLSGLGTIVQALQQDGVDLRNIELNFRPPVNCYGGAQFC